MTEIGLLLATHIFGLVCAGLVVRWAIPQEASTAELRRFGAALQRATDTLFRGAFHQVTRVTLGLGGLVFASELQTARPATELGTFERAFWAATWLGLGAATACCAAWVGAQACRTAAIRTLPRARQSMDQALAAAMLTNGAGAVAIQALSVGGSILPFLVLFAMKGGFSAQGSTATLAHHISELLPNYGLGAAVGVLIVHRAGAIYHAAGTVASKLGSEGQSGLDPDDLRNPALVASLVGNHVGPATAKCVDFFLSATLANLAALVTASVLHQQTGSFSLGALPLAIRAFGLIGSAFGLLGVRTTETAEPERALWRGEGSAAVVVLGGVLGACSWLGGQHWFGFFAAGALGLGAAIALTHLNVHPSFRRLGTSRDLTDLEKQGPAMLLVQGLGATWLVPFGSCIILCGSMVGAWQCGVNTGVQGGGVVASLTAASSFLAMGPYFLTLGTFASTTETVRALASPAGNVTPESQRRGLRLSDAGFAGGIGAQVYLVACGAIVVLTSAEALSNINGNTIDLAKPVVGWCGLVGAGLVFAYASNMTRAAVRVARAMLAEVDRQLDAARAAVSHPRGGSPELLEALPLPRSEAKISRTYTPSYRACTDLGEKGALSGLALPVLMALLTPVLLGFALLLMYRSKAPGVAIEGLASFVIIAALTGLGAALTTERARVVLSGARRVSRPRNLVDRDREASLSSEAIADVVGNSAGPAAHLLARAVAIVFLMIAPLLH